MYNACGKIIDEDVSAIYAYLQTIKFIKNQVEVFSPIAKK